MENEKAKVLVVYEDGQEALETAAKEIKAGLGRKATVKLRAASEVSVPEILAASAYAFGVANPGAHAWGELRRVLAGMNLAGRRVGFFVSAPRAADSLKAAFAPAELSPVADDHPAGSPASIRDWSAALADRP